MVAQLDKNLFNIGQTLTLHRAAIRKSAKILPHKKP